MNFFRRPPSAVLRSLLALLLVCAQIFAAAHALGHIGELSALARVEAGPAASLPASGEEGLPAAERHERCLLCLAAAALAAALPPALPLLAAASLPPSPPRNAAFAPRVSRLPRPPARGPPLLPV